jgi:hypothetical protein
MTKDQEIIEAQSRLIKNLEEQIKCLEKIQKNHELIIANLEAEIKRLNS